MNLIGKVVEKEKLVGELSQGVEYYKGSPGPKGDKGEPFKYEDFTPEQLESLRGPKGDDGFIKFEELTPEQKEELRGPKGDAFTYEDFTPEQLNALKGQPGQKGDKGDAFTYADFTQEQLEALKGQDGKNGKDFTYDDFTAEQLEALRGPAGRDGKDFTYDDFTPEQLNALKGQDGYTPQKGIDYFDGSNGKDGKDGVSITHTWNGTSLSITSASGTSSADLRGPAGQDGYTPIKGVDYFDGAPGPAGQDYVLTEDDKTAIANIVIGVLPTAEGVNV